MPTPPNRPGSALSDRPAVWVALVCLVGAVPLLGPVLSQLGTHLLGIEFVDHYGTQWFYWFAERQLRLMESPGWTDLFFYPWGKDVYVDTGANVLDGLMAVPFRALLGPVLGYNIFVLLMMGLTAWAVARFAAELTDDRVAAATGGALVAFVPFLLQELIEGRATQALALFPALFLHQAWRSGTRPGLRAPLLGGVFLALCGYWYWYYALFCGLACFALGLTWILRPPPEAGPRARILARFALIAAVAALLVAPVAAPLMLAVAAQGSDVPGLMNVQLWGLSQVPTLTVHDTEAGLFQWHPLRGSFGFTTIHADGGGRVGDRLTANTWPLVLILLAGAGLARAHARRGLLALAGMTALIAAGPVLLIGDAYLGNPVYIALARGISVLRRLWWPGRAFALMAVLYGVGAAVLIAAARRRLPRLSMGLPVVMVGVHVGGMAQRDALPLPTWDATIPAGFRCLATGPEGAIIQLPFYWAQGHVYYQTAHGRPMLGGMRDEQDMFTPAEWRDFRDGNGMVRALIDGASEPEPALVWDPADQALLGEMGFRYVVLQLDSWEPYSRHLPALAALGTRHRRRRLRQELHRAFGSPVYNDARTEIYAPWGAPDPCGDVDIGPDTVLAGQPDPSLATGLSADTVVREVVPWFTSSGDPAQPASDEGMRP